MALNTKRKLENKKNTVGLTIEEQAKQNGLKNGICVKDSGFLNNNTWKNDLEKVLGSVAINDIKNHISQSSEGYEVKLEAKYDNNGKINLGRQSFFGKICFRMADL